jgi:uracil-DNA glycosylase family 4
MSEPRTASSWAGFLPKKSIFMARRLAADAGAGITTLNPSDSLARIAAELEDCTRCKLCENRKSIVIGEGNSSAQLIFVGEGPGEQEDIIGRPFVGKAGQLLEKMIEAMGLTREQVYVANIVKCRPPGDRSPESDEIATCGKFIERQIDAIRPKVIVALGNLAAQTLLKIDADFLKMRGSFRDYRGAKLMPTFHPADLLRNPEGKRDAWEDLKQVKTELSL